MVNIFYAYLELDSRQFGTICIRKCNSDTVVLEKKSLEGGFEVSIQDERESKNLNNEIILTESNSDLSRRDLLKCAAGMVGAASVISAGVLASAEVTEGKANLKGKKSSKHKEHKDGHSDISHSIGTIEAHESLTVSESFTLEAICARIVPTDELGPGATEARVVRFIDRSLVSALRDKKESYSIGLAAIDEYSLKTKQKTFGQLLSAEQDNILTDLEKDLATGFLPSSSGFFKMVISHTMQGMFSDPYYGGNANFVGWDLISYPGIRMMVSEEDQSMNTKLKPIRVSAYEISTFAGVGSKKNGK